MIINITLGFFMKLYGFVFALFLITGLVNASDSSSQALHDRNEALARLEKSNNKCGENFRQTNGYKTPTREQQKAAREELMKQVQQAPRKTLG